MCIIEHMSWITSQWKINDNIILQGFHVHYRTHFLDGASLYKINHKMNHYKVFMCMIENLFYKSSHLH